MLAPSYPYEIVDDLNDGQGIGNVIEPNETDPSHITFKKDAGYKENTLYTYSLQPNVNTVEIPSSIQNFQLKLSDNQEVTIVLPKDGNDVAVNFTGNPIIKVDSDQSSNLDVIGNGVLTINTPNVEDLKDETLNVGTIQPNGDKIELKSNAPKLNIKKIDIYPIEGQPTTTISGNENGETSCEGLYLQGRSNLVVKNIDLSKDIYIGLLSSLHIEDKAKFEKARFHVKYSRQTPETIFPIVFKGDNGFLPFDGDIVIEKQEEGAIINADQEEILIAEFDGQNQDQSYNACLNYSAHYKGGEGFNDANCYNSTDEGSNKAYMKSTKSQKKGDDDKGGLSAGAIAGIVIACVVVVAAIIALLVYFLVIKKRNQSTTSTQGDSSIAI
ncbi:hypothetical protein M9Y10_020868 [Tritrichomonas musculus]|uniref:Adhesin domain-containing protein n=1 Tax=Tritrichomonas musculus TaxID=1915356 RepID=A0ABR2HEX2_9EUKA